MTFTDLEPLTAIYEAVYIFHVGYLCTLLHLSILFLICVKALFIIIPNTALKCLVMG